MKKRHNKPLNELWFVSLILGLGLINYPFIEIFNKDELFAGIPLLFLYFFCLWPAYIFVAFFFSRRFDHDGDDSQDPS